MRVHDPIGGPPDLDSFFQAYDQHFQGLGSYERHLQRLAAGYSRGDGPDELHSTFSFAVQKLVEADEKSRAQYGADKNILAHHGRYAALFRAALIYLTFGLCLRAPRFEIEAILRCCDRGDPLLETLARVAAPGSEARQLAPAFYRIFDRLYDALGAPSNQRPGLILQYLNVWYREKMEGFAFKGDHLLKQRWAYVGYWCFEAAGVVAALGIEDTMLVDHPQYPSDLVAFYRAQNTS
jgi:hypothetical protein